MRTLIIGAAVLLCVLPTSSALSDFENGNSLLRECDAGDAYSAAGLARLGECLGYIEAVADIMSTGNPVNGFRACLPTKTTGDQLRNVVSVSLNIHPRRQHLGAPGLVAQALQKAFPCQQ